MSDAPETPKPSPAADAPGAKPPEGPAGPEKISIQDFKKVLLKVGKVTEAGLHPNADRLLVLKVDIGGEVRQIVSGIRKWYEPEKLVGRSVIVVANLKPAVLRGEESQGMVLAASSGEEVILLQPDRDAAPGSLVT